MIFSIPKYDTLSEYSNYLSSYVENQEVIQPNYNGNEIINKSVITQLEGILNNKNTSEKNEVIKLSPSTPTSTKLKRNSTNYKTKNKLLNQKSKSYVYEKKFPEKTFGRISNQKRAEGITGIHTKDNVDNGKRKAIVDCIRNTHFVINSLSYEYYKIELLEPTITPQIGNDHIIKELFNKSIKDIYFCSRSKNHSGDNANTLKKNIEKILEEEENNNKIKILKILFNKNFNEFLLMYLHDNPILNHYDNNLEEPFVLPGFDTYKGGLNDLSQKIKERIKKNLLNLLKNK